MTHERSEYGLPEEIGDTATRERAVAERRLIKAEQDRERTNAVVDMLLAAVRGVNELHVENGYAPKLRAIFRS